MFINGRNTTDPYYAAPRHCVMYDTHFVGGGDSSRVSVERDATTHSRWPHIYSVRHILYRNGGSRLSNNVIVCEYIVNITRKLPVR